ncbi:MAG: hypothetical protein COS92_04880 [Desulfobacterales bacterium CG07_land_8_20_14_0_80_52_14]|nr:MAG: hypothetical protein COS92_04880 [Desulfobacterales bacterium CG07_land_8_20_14_0_80_52_14]
MISLFALSNGFCHINFDGIVKSRKCSLSVIPAKAGIQCFQTLMKPLDPVFQRGDDFLRSHQFCTNRRL